MIQQPLRRGLRNKTQTLGDILVTTNRSQSRAKLRCDILVVIADTERVVKSWSGSSNDSPDCIEGV